MQVNVDQKGQTTKHGRHYETKRKLTALKLDGYFLTVFFK